MVSEVRSKVVEDCEPPGTGGIVGGGLNRWRGAAGTGGAPATNWRCSGYNVARKVVEEIE
jgi:hypothetical protein